MERNRYNTRNSNSKNGDRLYKEIELRLQLQGGIRKKPRCLPIQRKAAAAAAVRAGRRLNRPSRNLEAAANDGGAMAPLEKRGGSSSAKVNGFEWPMLSIQLTLKEKEEDFLIFKGSKPSLRPKKRAKHVQKSINMVTPGLWMADLTPDRYEVKEKPIPGRKQQDRRVSVEMEEVKEIEKGENDMGVLHL